MTLSPRYLRMKLADAGLFPASKVARVACYVLALDVLLFVLQLAGGWFKWSWADSLGGWVSFLSFIAIVLFSVLALRWMKAKMLWRLRNRLIVTYVFIGVIPVVLLVALTVGSFYLFAGQFATFIVTTGLDSQVASLESTNTAITHQVAAQMKRGARSGAEVFEDIREADKGWADRQICVWLGPKIVVNSTPTSDSSAPPVLSPHLGNSFRAIVRDHDQLYLRALRTVPIAGETVTVLSSEPFDQHMLQELAGNLGEISLYTVGLNLRKVDRGQGRQAAVNDGSKVALTLSKPEGDYVLDTGKETPRPTYTAGAVPPAAARMDPQVTFFTTVSVIDWDTGSRLSPAGIGVQTRVSKIYERLFAALGDFAPAVEFGLLFVAIFFGVIELVALIVGTSLTRTVTGTVAQLYDATKHINRGDFSHRIPVKSNDQVAALANSFNSMTASLQQLMLEQKEKQKLENELVIAQEVQSQLFPHHISQLASLEVHGFCRPASTVSGDYYDFLTLDSDRLILAVGDISGKGISAALLMATIHSAVRAYSLQDIPALREPVAAGVAAGSSLMVASRLHNLDVSPSALLSLLNHQLFESTPSEKYATLFLGIYNGTERQLTYTNGGHLPPIVMSEDGSIRRLECGGTVVGLFDHATYEESSVQLRKGEIFLAYSDGVTEPENDFGEFGEHRLIEILRENRDLPLPRISEIVTAAVDDWIGANKQPDDVTLVLARAR